MTSLSPNSICIINIKETIINIFCSIFVLMFSTIDLLSVLVVFHHISFEI